jgi:PAS domain S-box-containing protein
MSAILAHGLQILLVESDSASAEAIVEHIAFNNPRRDNVLTVGSLALAESYLRSTRLDIVLLDLWFADGQGLKGFETLRRCAPEVPIVVLLGPGDEELGHACIAAGAQDYLSKAEIGPGNLGHAISLAITRNYVVASDYRRSVGLPNRLAAIVETSSDAILSSTRDGIITSWNRGAEAILGYSRDEVVGQALLEVMRTADADARRAQRIVLDRTLRGDEPGEAQEVVRLRRDGSPVWLSIAAHGIRDQSGKVVALAAICRDITSRKRGQGFVQKHEAAEEFRQAIPQVGARGTYLHGATAVHIAKGLGLLAPRVPHHLLSERELATLRRIAVGRTVKEIAFEFGLSDKTVATYVGRIRTKTSLGGHVEMARYALEHGIVD